MAKVFSIPDIDSWGDYHTHQEKLDAIENDPWAVYGQYMMPKDMDKHGIVGKIIKFGVADGYAMYLVMNSKPLQLCHIPFMDGYYAHPVLLRGLRVADVKTMTSRKSFKQLLMDKKS